MHGTQKVSFDILLEIVKYLEPEDRASLALADRELHWTIYPSILEHALFNLKGADALAPLRHAVRTDNLPMLSEIYNLIKSDTRDWHCSKCARNWSWYLGNYYSLDLFELAMRNSSKSFEFLLDTMEDSGMVMLSGEEGLRQGYRWCTTPDDLFQRAIWLDKLECIRIILDRQHLFDLVGEDRPDCITCERYWVLEELISVPTAEYLIDRGFKFDCNPLSNMVRRDRSYNADLCRMLVNKMELDVDAMFETREGWQTPLIQACGVACPAGIETLLELGANPNGVEDGRVTSPIHQLLFSKRAWRGKWPKVATAMYGCFKVLLEHGASISKRRRPRDRHPIQTLLGNIWRLLCPSARVAAGVGKHGAVTKEQLLEALLTLDIEPFDKLCDVVVDANPSYAAMAEGLRGKQRLVKLLRRQRKLPVKFKWDEYDSWAFNRDEFGVDDSNEKPEPKDTYREPFYEQYSNDFPSLYRNYLRGNPYYTADKSRYAH